MRAFILAVVLAASAPSAWADLAGELDPRYKELKRDWLAGDDDLSVLRGMASLARRGNLAAQVTLGMIQIQPQTYWHVAKDLSQKDRRAIFYKPNGRFGERWLEVAARSSPMAALLTTRDIDDYEAHAMALADAGLTKRAIETATSLLVDNIGRLRVLSHPNLLPYTKVTANWYAALMETSLRLGNQPQLADEVMRLRMKLPPLEFKDRLLAFEQSDFVQLDDLPDEGDALRLRGSVLLLHPDLAPLTRIAREACPEDTAYHLGVLFYLQGGSSLRLLLLSPFEPIISTEEWQKSERFRGDVLRSWEPGSPRFEILQELSECFAQAALAET